MFFYLHYTILVQALIMSFFHYLNCFLTATIYTDPGFLPIHIFPNDIFKTNIKACHIHILLTLLG